MKQTLVVRADANAGIGNGHLMRSLALAQAWQSLGGRSVLVTSVPEGALPSSVHTSGVECAFVPDAYPDPGDVALVQRLLRDFGNAWVCCDGYRFDAEYTQALAGSARGVVVIDDIAHAALYRADVIVNQNIFADRFRYICDRDTTKLLGPRYALLRREFPAWADWQRQTSDRVKHLLVMMGGGDPDNLTQRVMRALRRIEFSDLEVKVIVGSNNPHVEALETEAARLDAPRVELLRNPADLPSLMAWADLAISAGGSTCWELCFMSVPSVLVTLADNQAGITAGLAEAGAAVHLGSFRKVDEDLLVHAVSVLLDDKQQRQRLSSHARALVDGRGAMRVCRVLLGEPEGALDG
jgi:UDP-2,4-diacetamido-2,4,6-trideoxy-beta-L-altropyranose hydrolase